MTGMFDDLIPRQPPSVPVSGAGLFDDLIPQQATAAPAAPSVPGLFDDLIPAPVPGARPAPPISLGDSEIPWQLQSPPQPTAPESDRFRALRIGVQGAGRGIADFIGAPVDLAAMGLNALASGAETAVNAVAPSGAPVSLPRVTNPVGGSQSLADVVSGMTERVGLPSVPADEMTGAEQLGYNVNRYGTAAIAGAAGLSRAAAARFAPGQGPIYPRTGDALLRPYADDPARVALVDTAGGVGAGAAITAADVVVPKDSPAKPVVDLVATLAGGMAGATVASGGRVAAGASRAVSQAMPDPSIPLDPNTRMPVSVRTADRTARFLQGQASDPQQAAADITRRAADYRAEGLPVPTAGVLSTDPGLIGVEQAQRLADRSPFIARDRQLQVGAAEEVRSLGPVNADPRAPGLAIQQDVRDQLDAADRRVEDIQAQRGVTGDELAGARQTEADRVGPYRTTEAAADAARASRDLDRELVDNTLRPLTAEKNRRYQQADPAGTVAVDPAPLVETAAAIRQSANRLAPAGLQLPETFLQRIEAFAPAGNAAPAAPVTWRDLNDLYPTVQTYEAQARRRGAYDLADNLRRLRGAIDGQAERLIAEGGDTGQAIAGARAFYREKYAPFFGQGTGRTLRDDVFADDRARTGTPPSATAERFLFTGSGSREAADDLSRILQVAANPAEARDAARRYVLAGMARTIGNDGNVSIPALKAWRSNNSAMLDGVPWIKDEVDGLVRDLVNGRSRQNAMAGELRRLDGDLRAAERDAIDTERRINRSALAVFLDASPDNAVRGVFGSRDPEAAMSQVVAQLGNRKEAVAGLKRAVADYLTDRLSTARVMDEQGTRSISTAALVRDFDGLQPVLAKLYSPSEMNALVRARKLIEPLQQLDMQATRGSPTAENNAMLWRGVEAGLKATYGVLKGGGITRTLKVAASMLPDGSADVRQLVGRAMFDPDLAAHLLTRPAEEVVTPAWNAKLNRLMGYAAAARASTSGDEEAAR